MHARVVRLSSQPREPCSSQSTEGTRGCPSGHTACFALQHSNSRQHTQLGRQCIRSQRGARLRAAAAAAPSDSQPASVSAPAADAPPAPRTLREEAQRSNAEVADKLIAVFRSKSREEWRKLIAFSKQWRFLAPQVFDRIEELSRSESDVDKVAEWRTFLRQLRNTTDELARYDQLLTSLRESAAAEWPALVAGRRGELGQPFFDHLRNLIAAAQADARQQQALVELATQLVAVMEAHDKAAADEQALSESELAFESILRADSLEEADARIDSLAASGKLDPALLLTMAKAYAAAKDTDKTRDEVKDLMAHLYFKAKETYARQQPPAVRILKQLLTLEGDSELAEGLAAAFQPGEFETEDQDYLFTTPQVLLTAVQGVLDAFDQQRGRAGLVGEAAELMNPQVIERLRKLRAAIMSDFM